MPEISAQVEKYLREIQIPLRLACLSAQGWPVVLSLWFLYDNGKLYCATQEKALVAQHLMANGRCAFEVASDLPPYCGVRGQGRALIDQLKGPEILRRLLARYGIAHDSPLGKTLLSRGDSEVAIVIEAINWYTWNFTERMEGSLAGATREKPCP